MGTDDTSTGAYLNCVAADPTGDRRTGARCSSPSVTATVQKAGARLDR